jgi:hypothetical protein
MLTFRWSMRRLHRCVVDDQTSPSNHCDNDDGSNMLWQWLPRGHSGRKQGGAAQQLRTSMTALNEQISGMLRRGVTGAVRSNILQENRERPCSLCGVHDDGARAATLGLKRDPVIALLFVA